MMYYELHLPFPPTINSYYVKTKQGQFISMKGKKFRHDVAEAVEEQLSGLEIGLDYRLHGTVVLHMPDKRTRDLDNYMKPLLDALTKAEMWEDDVLLDQLNIYRGTVATPATACARVLIHEAGPLIPYGFDISTL